jgi:hypothetical protein
MAENFKAQATVTTANTNQDLYEADCETVLGACTVCNRSGSAQTYRLAVRPFGAAISDEHYIKYGESVAANTTVELPRGIPLSDTDIITIQGSSTDMTFFISGVRINPPPL